MNQSQQSHNYELSILQSLRQMTRAAEIYSKKLAAEHSITGPQLVCLLTIKERQPVTAAEVAKEVHVSPSTLVGVLDRLEQKSLIERRRDQKDRRRVAISLSPFGCELVESAPPPLHDKLSERLKSLSELEQASISLALKKVVSLMTDA